MLNLISHGIKGIYIPRGKNGKTPVTVDCPEGRRGKHFSQAEPDSKSGDCTNKSIKKQKQLQK